MTVPLPKIPSRTEAIRAFREGGGGLAAVLPVHNPRALFRAFDLLPVEIWGPPSVDASLGGAHIQPYACSLVRNALSFIKSGGIDQAQALLVPHTCDSLQGLGSLLIDFIPPKAPVLTLYLPRGRGGDETRFLAEELRSLYSKLAEALGKKPSEESLGKAVEREEAADALLGELHQKRGEIPLSDVDFYRLVRSREYLPAETFGEMARGVLETSMRRGPLPPGSRSAREDPLGVTSPRVAPHPSLPPEGEGEIRVAGVPIMLSGVVPEPMDLFETIASVGGRVVADDFAACGRRLYPAGKGRDPFVRMADGILGAPPDPMRGSPIQARLDHLLATARRSGARGVVFHGIKFCDPELFDLPLLRRGLKGGGLTSLVLESDLNDPLSNQQRTRLEAFFETLGQA